MKHSSVLPSPRTLLTAPCFLQHQILNLCMPHIRAFVPAVPSGISSLDSLMSLLESHVLREPAPAYPMTLNLLDIS